MVVSLMSIIILSGGWVVVLNERIFKLVSLRLAEHTYQVPSREASQ